MSAGFFFTAFTAISSKFILHLSIKTVLRVIFSPVGGSAAVLLTLGWSLSSSSKNSVVPPVSLAMPCRSLLQARGPRPRPKHLQRWCSRNVQFMSHLLRKLYYDTTIIKWQLSSLSTFTEWSSMHCLQHTYNTYRRLLSEQIKYQPLATTWTSVSIYLWNYNGTERLPCVLGKREFGVIDWTELLFGHSEGSQSIWLIESLKRAGDRIIEKARALSALSKNSKAVRMARYYC